MLNRCFQAGIIIAVAYGIYKSYEISYQSLKNQLLFFYPHNTDHNMSLHRKISKVVQISVPNRKYSLELINLIKTFSILNVQDFEAVLQDKSTANKTIILAFTDESFVAMAINLYISSFLKFNIQNYVFVCSQPKATTILRKHNITSVHLWNDTIFLETSDFNTRGFGHKAIKKVVLTNLALLLGYNVLFTDVDIVMFKNPFPYLVCDKCDIMFQPDTKQNMINSGFYFAYATERSIALHTAILRQTSCWKFRQQICFEQFTKKIKLSVKMLPYTLFPSGLIYFDNALRMFASDKPCSSCVIVHNNWIVSFHAKRYRFKENLLWYVNENGYYSDPSRKYLLYSNSKDFGKDITLSMEKRALRNAFYIGQLLNRTLILPKFFCYSCFKKCPSNDGKPHCTAQVHFNIKLLDELFGNQYREHMFLSHKLVPEETKLSQSPIVFIENRSTTSESYKTIDLAQYFQHSKDNEKTFLFHMQPLSKFAVLRFSTLYTQFFNVNDNRALSMKFKKVTKGG